MNPQPSIAHYSITAKLGEGGMGAVYRATDTKLNREVAIKVLPDAFARDPDRMARFAREAQVLASLNHPNIATIYGVEDNALIMELIEGQDLHGPLPLDTAIACARQIAGALEAAHEKGVVHRDLKPANIKVTPDGVVKLLDFGLAKAAEASAAASSASPTLSPTISLSMTQAGVILGTAAYMAPEQARGKSVDKRADIWAFGVVFFEMLTGRQIFTGGDTVTDIIAAVVTREPDWSTLPPGTPVAIRRLLERCLRKDPKLRLRDIGEARLLLDEPVVPETPAAAPASRRGAPWWAFAAAVTTIAAAAFWIGSRSSIPGPNPLMRLTVDLGPEAAATARFAAAISPNGTRLVFVAQGQNGRQQLATRLLDQTASVRLAGTDGAADPFFSPDGQWVGFIADSKLKKVPVQGGAPIVLCDVANARGAHWGQDGTIVFAAGTTTGLSKVPDSGGPPQQLTDPAAKKQRSHRWPQVMPGGRWVLFTGHVAAAAFDDAEIDALDLKSGQWKTVQTGGYFGRYLPSGHLVFTHQGTLFAVRLDPDTMTVSGTPAPVLDDMSAALISGKADLDFSGAASGSGTLIYRSGKVRDINYPMTWLDSAGATQPLLPTPRLYKEPRLSPDGRLVAATVGSFLASDVYVWDIQSGAQVQLTSDGHNESPVWARDGKHVIYASNSGGVYSIMWLRADGKGQPLKLLDAAEPLFPNSMSPDGRILAYHQLGRGTGGDIWTLPLDLSNQETPKSGKPEVFLQTPKVERAPAISPDGHWLAYDSDETGSSEIYVRPFPGGARGAGGKWLISAGNGRGPLWSRGGRQLFYETNEGRLMVVDYEANGESFAAAKPRPWASTRTMVVSAGWNYDIAPDGKRVAALVSEETEQEQTAGLRLTFLLNFFDELRRRVP